MTHFKYLLGIVLLGISANIYAAVDISDRIKIDATTIMDPNEPLDIIAGDLFGYYIENIGDLDSDGVEDLAVSQYKNHFSVRQANKYAGRVMLLFMNADGSVKDSKSITQSLDTVGDNTVGDACVKGIGKSVGVETSVGDSVESLAYLGNLINGNPTLAMGIPFVPPVENGVVPADDEVASGKVIYIVELDASPGKEGDVLSCGRIAVGENGFPSVDNGYFGFSIAATDIDDDEVMELIVSSGPAIFTLFLNGSGGDLVRTFETNTYANIGIASDRAHSMRSVDGKRKLVIGSQDSIINGKLGSFYIVNLDANGIFESSTLYDGTDLADAPNGSSFGSGVESLGDMNRDGVVDLLVGSESGSNGQAYIVFLNVDDSVRETQIIHAATESVREGLDPNEPSEALNFDNYFGHGMGLWRSFDSHVVVGIGSHEDDTEGNNTGAMRLFTINKTAQPPAFSQTISPAVISVNGTVTTATLQFIIDNTVSAYPVDSLAFTNTLPSGLEIASPSNASSSCGGTLTANPNSTYIDFSSGSAAANTSCTISVDLVATGDSTVTLTNTSGNLSSNEGDSGASSADITVDAVAPVITLNGNEIVELRVGDIYNELGASATDDRDGDLIVINNNSTVDTSTVDTYMVTYTAIDEASNRTDVIRTINVTAIIGTQDPNDPNDPNDPMAPNNANEPMVTPIPTLGPMWIAVLALLVLAVVRSKAFIF